MRRDTAYAPVCKGQTPHLHGIHSIMADLGLNTSARVIAWALHDYMRRTGSRAITHRTLADITGVSEHTVWTQTKLLQQAGWLSWRMRKRSIPNEYYFRWEPKPVVRSGHKYVEAAHV